MYAVSNCNPYFVCNNILWRTRYKLNVFFSVRDRTYLVLDWQLRMIRNGQFIMYSMITYKIYILPPKYAYENLEYSLEDSK